MEISIGPSIIDGKTEVLIQYFEEIDEFGFAADVTVWVDYCDSQQEMYARAEKAAEIFLERMLAAHRSVED